MTSSCSTSSSPPSRSSSTSWPRCPAALKALFTGKIHSRVPATLLIALGAFIPALTDSLNRFGSTEWFQLGKLLGALLLLAGFLVSAETFSTIRVPFTSIVLRGARSEAREATEH